MNYHTSRRRVCIITCEFVKQCYDSINRVYLWVTFLQYIIDAVEVAVFSINNGSHGYLNVKGVYSAPAQLTCMLWADNKRSAGSTTVHILSYVLKGPLVIFLLYMQMSRWLQIVVSVNDQISNAPSMYPGCIHTEDIEMLQHLFNSLFWFEGLKYCSFWFPLIVLCSARSEDQWYIICIRTMNLIPTYS